MMAEFSGSLKGYNLNPEVIGSHTRFLSSGVKLEIFFEKDSWQFSQEKVEQEGQ